MIKSIAFAGRFRRQMISALWKIRILCCDSAAYNIKALGYAIDNREENEIVSVMLCMIHVLCRARARTLVWFDVPGPIFCLVNLMRLSPNREKGNRFLWLPRVDAALHPVLRVVMSLGSFASCFARNLSLFCHCVNNQMIETFVSILLLTLLHRE